MIKVAIVGNIASGKSTVEKIVESLGYKVIDTDEICHELLVELEEIKNAFSKYDVFENGQISREKLGKLVFSDQNLKTKLENILYPPLKVKIKEFFGVNKNEKMVFVSIPLLFEAGMEDLFDKIIFIYAPDDMRLNRLIQRDNYSVEYAKIRLESQLPQEEKMIKSDFIVKNETSVYDLEKQIKFAIEQIR